VEKLQSQPIYFVLQKKNPKKPQEKSKIGSSLFLLLKIFGSQSTLFILQKAY